MEKYIINDIPRACGLKDALKNMNVENAYCEIIVIASRCSQLKAHIISFPKMAFKRLFIILNF